MKQLNTFLQADGTYRYSVTVPDFVADHEERPHYEKDRFASMEANLKPGDVLFDIGAELGWQSVIYAGFVGNDNVCLFESATVVWPIIRATWEANKGTLLPHTFAGFASNRTSRGTLYGYHYWPSVAHWPVPENYYDMRHKVHQDNAIQEVMLDDFMKGTGIVPAALTIDVEGGEGRVLQGAIKILNDSRPLVWLSLHPEKRLRSYGISKYEVMRILFDAGYEKQYLGVDHEEHYFFFPTERKNDVTKVVSPWGTYGRRDLNFEQAIPGWEDSMGMPYTADWGVR